MKNNKVVIAMRIFSRHLDMTHPGTFYRFLVDNAGYKTDKSTYKLGKLEDLETARRRYRSRRRTNLFSAQVGNWVREFTLTFHVTPEIDLNGRRLYLRLEAIGSTYVLKWTTDVRPNEEPSSGAQDQEGKKPSKSKDSPESSGRRSNRDRRAR